jgi:hypothetical protein
MKKALTINTGLIKSKIPYLSINKLPDCDCMKPSDVKLLFKAVLA